MSIFHIGSDISLSNLRVIKWFCDIQGKTPSSSNTETFRKERHKAHRPLQDSSNTPSAAGGNHQEAGAYAGGGGSSNGTADYEALNDMEIEVIQTTGCQVKGLVTIINGMGMVSIFESEGY